jgi:hypothetical protein
MSGSEMIHVSSLCACVEQSAHGTHDLHVDVFHNGGRNLHQLGLLALT